MAQRIHATALALGGKAALIRGRSGSGKSDLALRCLALSPSPLLSGEVLLISDDQVLVETGSDGLAWASAPEPIKGKLEVRGLGILEVRAAAPAPIALVVDLVNAAEIDRLPDEHSRTDLLGQSVPLLKLAPFEASAPVKLLLALLRAAPAKRD